MAKAAKAAKVLDTVGSHGDGLGTPKAPMKKKEYGPPTYDKKGNPRASIMLSKFGLSVYEAFSAAMNEEATGETQIPKHLFYSYGGLLLLKELGYVGKGHGRGRGEDGAARPGRLEQGERGAIVPRGQQRRIVARPAHGGLAAPAGCGRRRRPRAASRPIRLSVP
jgi:hypothetical protein